MKATLKDGTVLEGTPEEIKEFLKDKEDNGFTITPAPAIIPQGPSLNGSFGSNANPCEGCDLYERLQKGEVVVDDRCTFCSKNPNKLTCISGGTTNTKVTLNQEVKEEQKIVKTIIKKPEPKKIDKGLQDVKLPDYMSPNFRGFN